MERVATYALCENVRQTGTVTQGSSFRKKKKKIERQGKILGEQELIDRPGQDISMFGIREARRRPKVVGKKAINRFASGIKHVEAKKPRTLGKIPEPQKRKNQELRENHGDHKQGSERFWFFGSSHFSIRRTNKMISITDACCRVVSLEEWL